MIDVRAIATALGSPRQAGKEWYCLCPLHDDHDPSLRLTVGESGGLVGTCPVCKPTHQELMAELERRGLKPERSNGQPQRFDDPVVTTYDYRDASGEILFRVCRTARKRFFQQRPDGRGGWEMGLKGVRRVLYRLPEVLQVDSVVVVEGEKDADRLASLGIPATTAPMGAGKQWARGYTQSLAGKHVAIIPDNDAPGHQHAAAVASCLEGYAASVRIVNLPDLPDKGDVSDWLDAGGSRDLLVQLLKDSPTLQDQRQAPQRTDNWLWLLSRSGRDQAPIANEANVIVALDLAPELDGVIRYNVMSMRSEVLQLPTETKGRWREWSDEDYTMLTIWLQQKGIHRASVAAVKRAVESWSVDRGPQHHPVRDYLDGLKWDGERRISGWLNAYCGAEHSRYTSEVGRRTLIAAVARVFRPGCKVDTCLVLEGEEYLGKSQTLRILGGEWFSDQMPHDLSSIDAKRALRGKWIVEFAELAVLRTTKEINHIKAFITSQRDSFTDKWQLTETHLDRQCIICGTINDSVYLRSDTGNRRFWPVTVDTIDLDALARDRNQLWAEAVAEYRNGSVWHIDDPSLIEEATEEQAKRELIDPWHDCVAAYLDLKALEIDEFYRRLRVDQTEARWPRISCEDVLTKSTDAGGIGLEISRATKVEKDRIGRLFAKLGWRYKLIRMNEKRIKTWTCR